MPHLVPTVEELDSYWYRTSKPYFKPTTGGDRFPFIILTSTGPSVRPDIPGGSRGFRPIRPRPIPTPIIPRPIPAPIIPRPSTVHNRPPPVHLRPTRSPIRDPISPTHDMIPPISISDPIRPPPPPFVHPSVSATPAVGISRSEFEARIQSLIHLLRSESETRIQSLKSDYEERIAILISDHETLISDHATLISDHDALRSEFEALRGRMTDAEGRVAVSFQIFQISFYYTVCII